MNNFEYEYRHAGYVPPAHKEPKQSKSLSLTNSGHAFLKGFAEDTGGGISDLINTVLLPEISRQRKIFMYLQDVAKEKYKNHAEIAPDLQAICFTHKSGAFNKDNAIEYFLRVGVAHLHREKRSLEELRKASPVYAGDAKHKMKPKMPEADADVFS